VTAAAAYPNVVLKLNSSRRVKLYFLQGLSDDIVRLTLALLCGLDGGGLFYITLVVDIELPEGIGKGKDVALLELRVFPEPER
jgi:hypothetical protein